MPHHRQYVRKPLAVIKNLVLKQILLLLALFNFGISNGQIKSSSTEDIFSSVPDLKLEIRLTDSIYSNYFLISRGIEQGDVVTFHKDSTFEIRIANTLYYTGIREISQTKKRIILKPKKKAREEFCIVRYYRYLYLIPAEKIVAFINRYKKSKEAHKDVKPFELEKGGELYASEFLVASDLANKNYTMMWENY